MCLVKAMHRRSERCVVDIVVIDAMREARCGFSHISPVLSQCFLPIRLLSELSWQLSRIISVASFTCKRDLPLAHTMARKERTAEEAAAKAARKAEKSSKHTKTLTLDDKLDINSPIEQITATLFLALSPVTNKNPLEGLCAEHLSPLMLQYYPPFDGVVLSYENARLSEGPDNDASSPVVLARSINEYGVEFVWVTADFLIFRPAPGTYLKGEVNLQNEGIFGLIFMNYFTVSIPTENMPPDWKWQEDRWVNGQGEVEKEVVCKVEDFEPSGEGSISITGTLVGL